MIKLKKLITKPLKVINSNRIKEIQRLQMDLSCIAEDYDSVQIERTENNLMSAILRLSPLCKKENSTILNCVSRYFEVMYFKGRLILDSTTEYTSVFEFTNFFLNNRQFLLEIFYSKDLQKVIDSLIRMNLAIHRVQKANQIWDAYYSVFEYNYLAKLVYRVIISTCGSIKKEIITDLYQNVSVAYYKECKTIKKKAVFLRNLFLIIRRTGWECEEFDALIKDFQQRTINKCNGKIVETYSVLIQYNCYKDLVNDWINSIDTDSIKDRDQRAFHNLCNLTIERIKGNLRIKKQNSKSPGNTKDIYYRRMEFLNNLREREYRNKQLKDEIPELLRYYKDRCNESNDIAFRYKCNIAYHSIKNQFQPIQFWSDFEEAYEKVAKKTTKDCKPVQFFFVNEYSLVNGALALPFILTARKEGIQCHCTSPKLYLEEVDSMNPLYDVVGHISGDSDVEYYNLNDIDYNCIDIEHKKIMVHGMNVYQPIFEFVSRYQFTYNFNYDTDAWARARTHSLVKTYDRLFTYIESIEKIALSEGYQVYFLSNAPHIHNASAFRIFCEEKGYKNGLNYICISPGYDNYFANSTDPKTETITALNLTKNLNSRNSFLGTKEGFELYYENNRNRINEIRKKMDRHLNAQRGRDRQKELSEEKQIILNRLKEAHKDRKTIIVLNGKVIIDLAVKYTKGCVHSDMSEWITHAVSFAKQNPEKILLLIKPHPHENRSDLTLTSEKIDNLRSLIKCELGKNTIYLDNDMFKISELIPYMDLGMVWNGTSSLEFAAQGIKTLIADVWGHYDYPIGFVYPDSIEEYERFMLDPTKMVEPSDLADRAITFLEYMGSDSVRVPNFYTSTTAMNFHQRDSAINMEAVNNLVDHGDPVLEQLIYSCL